MCITDFRSAKGEERGNVQVPIIVMQIVHLSKDIRLYITIAESDKQYLWELEFVDDYSHTQTASAQRMYQCTDRLIMDVDVPDLSI